jgi:hypothetical protein
MIVIRVNEAAYVVGYLKPHCEAGVREKRSFEDIGELATGLVTKEVAHMRRCDLEVELGRPRVRDDDPVSPNNS